MQNSQKIIKSLHTHVFVIRSYQDKLIRIASNQDVLCRSVRSILIKRSFIRKTTVLCIVGRSSRGSVD